MYPVESSTLLHCSYAIFFFFTWLFLFMQRIVLATRGQSKCSNNFYSYAINMRPALLIIIIIAIVA